ncbi:MAG: ABC transporter permease, partial [Longimicrobiales bacterium]|nr:ABC transporter permease [Longimicrobiales bacterium]
MSRFLQDLRFAARMLVKNPAFTGAVVVTLALGIGLNAAVFSAVHGLLLRPLPGVENPDRIVQVYRSWPGMQYGSNSIPHFRDLRDRSEEAGVVEGMASWAFVNLSLSSEGQSEIAWGEMVSANFFDVLGVEPALGRTFTPDESVERAGVGGSPVVVLSYGAWQARYGGSRDVIGRTVTINGSPFQIVGVAPEGFRGPMQIASPALWAPLAMEPTLMAGSGSNMEARSDNFMNIVARIPDGATVDRVRQGLDRVVDGLRETYPDEYEGSGIVVVPQSEAGIHPMIADSQVAMSSVILAVVALLLLVACVNVANLFLARAEHRRREIGIRLSVGAGRMRIVRQLLTESLLFALAAGVAGLGLAWVAIRVMNGIQPPTDLPLDFRFELSAPVLAFTLTAALVTGIVFGLVPAIQASKPETVGALKGDAAAPGGAGTKISRGLVVVQTALSVLLLLSAGIFLQNLRAASEMDVGFRADHLLMARVAPGLQGYDRARSEALYRNVEERVEALPEVTASAWAEIVPLGLSMQQTSVSVDGY